MSDRTPGVRIRRPLVTAAAVGLVLAIGLGVSSAFAWSEMPRDETCRTAMADRMPMHRMPMHRMPMHGAAKGMGPGGCQGMMSQGMHGAMMPGSCPSPDATRGPGMDPTASPCPARERPARHGAPSSGDPAEHAAATPAESVRIDVTLTDELTIEPATMTVAAGVPTTFVVTNAGVLPHEFVIGDEAVQEAHETAMQAMGSMTHDEPTALGLEAGETKELTMSFPEPGETLAGCHIPGHYAAGMRAAITVTP